MQNGWNEETKASDHMQMIRFVLSLSDMETVFVRGDAFKAYKALPQGDKAGYYLDLAHYCGMKMRGNL